MSEREHYKGKKTFSKDTPDTGGALKKMQYQLDAIERKLDSLLKQSRPQGFKNRYDAKPYREHDKPNSRYKSKHAGRKTEVSGSDKFYHKLQSGPKKHAKKSKLGKDKR